MFWCLGTALHRNCDISWVSSHIFLLCTSNLLYVFMDIRQNLQTTTYVKVRAWTDRPLRKVDGDNKYSSGVITRVTYMKSLGYGFMAKNRHVKYFFKVYVLWFMPPKFILLKSYFHLPVVSRGQQTFTTYLVKVWLTEEVTQIRAFVTKSVAHWYEKFTLS